MLRRAPTKNKRAFTLVEMSVVITLLALFAAMVVPNLARWRDTERRQEFFYEFRDMFAKTRQTAITNQTPQSIRFNGEDFVTVFVDQDGNEVERDSTRIPAGFEVVRFSLAGADSAAADWELVFYPDGQAEPAGIEIQENGTAWYLTIGRDGRSKFAQGNLPEPEQERWSAGDYAIRQ